MHTHLTVTALVLGACGGGGSKKPVQMPVADSSPAAPAADDGPITDPKRMIEKLEEIERAMCACATEECTKKVSAQLDAFSERQANVPPPKLSPEQDKRVSEIAAHVGECHENALNAAKP